jgi:hypothetical protein
VVHRPRLLNRKTAFSTRHGRGRPGCDEDALARDSPGPAFSLEDLHGSRRCAPGYAVLLDKLFLAGNLTVGGQFAQPDLLPEDFRELLVDRCRRAEIDCRPHKLDL